MEFLDHGYQMKDLIPVKHSMKAANSAPIHIDGAIILRLEGYGPDGRKLSAAVMTYVSPDAKAFFLSKEALIQLQVIPKDFPKLGTAVSNPSVAGILNIQQAKGNIANCGCLKRVPPPPKPKELDITRDTGPSFLSVRIGNPSASSTMLKMFADSAKNPRSIISRE